MCCFFFFKQKTAYEMRISDWSSDVCSSDLAFLRGLEVDMDGLRVVAHREIDDLRVGQRGAARLEHLADLPVLEPARVHPGGPQIGRASCRERVCEYV